MPHREQEFAELCCVCRERAHAHCVDCGAPTCSEHERCPACHRVWLLLPPAIERPPPRNAGLGAKALVGSLSGAAALTLAHASLGMAAAAAGLSAVGACAALLSRRQRDDDR